MTTEHGRVGQEPQIRENATTKEKFITFSMAQNMTKKDAETGLNVKVTKWIDVVLKYENFKNAIQFVKPGTIAIIQGPAAVNMYKDEKSNKMAAKLKINGIFAHFYFSKDNDKPTQKESDKSEILPQNVDTETGEIKNPDDDFANSNFESGDDLPF